MVVLGYYSGSVVVPGDGGDAEMTAPGGGFACASKLIDWVSDL